MINQIFFSGSVHRLANKIAVADDAAMAVALCKDYNLTGLTLFTDGTFMSVLEGRECDTLTVFKLVKDDPRFTHTNVVMEHGRERAEFTSYRIGFKDADFSNEVPSAFKLESATFAQALPQNPSPALRILTQTFARVNGFSISPSIAA